MIGIIRLINLPCASETSSEETIILKQQQFLILSSNSEILKLKFSQFECKSNFNQRLEILKNSTFKLSSFPDCKFSNLQNFQISKPNFLTYRPKLQDFKKMFISRQNRFQQNFTRFFPIERSFEIFSPFVPFYSNNRVENIPLLPLFTISLARYNIQIAHRTTGQCQDS